MVLNYVAIRIFELIDSIYLLNSAFQKTYIWENTNPIFDVNLCFTNLNSYIVLFIASGTKSFSSSLNPGSQPIMQFPSK